jgi:hypothetical protein
MAFERRPFYIVNEANGRVMEIHGGMGRAGNHVVSFGRRPARAESQLWYLDGNGIIHSMIMDFVLESKGILGDKVVVQQHVPGDRHQQWYLDGNRIINRDHPDKCLEIRGGENRDDADVVLHHYERRAYQHWRFEFV